MTLEELYNKVMSDRDTMGEFVKASGTGSLAAFAESLGCKTTDEEIRKFFMARCEGEGEISDDDAANVAGGVFDFGKWISDLFTSLFGGGSPEPAVTTVNRSSVLGGGMVRADNNISKSSVVGKGMAPATTTLSKSSIYKKL